MCRSSRRGFRLPPAGDRDERHSSQASARKVLPRSSPRPKQGRKFYSLAQVSVIHLAEVLAREFRPYGVTGRKAALSDLAAHGLSSARKRISATRTPVAQAVSRPRVSSTRRSRACRPSSRGVGVRGPRVPSGCGRRGCGRRGSARRWGPGAPATLIRPPLFRLPGVQTSVKREDLVGEVGIPKDGQGQIRHLVRSSEPLHGDLLA